MQKRAKITSKGQITIPHEVRKQLGVKAGDSSPFEKYRGIGNGRAGSGRKAVVRAIRELRSR
jgi:AbrB family looped-hinge helix DNA binding protein